MTAFDCTMCGECCQGRGGIFVSQAQLEAIAAFLGLGPEEFFQGHCEMWNGRISIRSGPDGTCLLWEGGCRVHPVKPDICRTWPYLDSIITMRENWVIARNNCRGFREGSTYEEFVAEARELRK